MKKEIKVEEKPKVVAEISFFAPTSKEAIMTITKGKFIWKGKEVKDTNKIYERFSEWLAMAEVKND